MATLSRSMLTVFTPQLTRLSLQTIPTFALSTGQKIPFLAWGNGSGDARQTALVSGTIALKAGIRHIDTAQGYDNEPETGEAITKWGGSPEEVWVTTKLSQAGGDPNGVPIPTADVRSSVLGTIQRLGFQPNLLLVHNPFVPAPGQLIPFWRELEALKESGELTASLGVSNFRPQDLELLLKEAKYKPVVNQLEYHPYVLTHLDPVLTLCAAHSILIEAYGPLTPVLRHPSASHPLLPILTRIASRLGVQTTDVLLLWTWAKGAVAVSSSGNEGRIQGLSSVQDMIAGGKVLTPEEVNEIETVGRKYHFRGYPEHMCVDYPAPDLPEA